MRILREISLPTIFSFFVLFLDVDAVGDQLVINFGCCFLVPPLCDYLRKRDLVYRQKRPTYDYVTISASTSYRHHYFILIIIII